MKRFLPVVLWGLLIRPVADAQTHPLRAKTQQTVVAKSASMAATLRIARPQPRYLRPKQFQLAHDLLKSGLHFLFGFLNLALQFRQF